jgi:hypothetical protein
MAPPPRFGGHQLAGGQQHDVPGHDFSDCDVELPAIAQHRGS